MKLIKINHDMILQSVYNVYAINLHCLFFGRENVLL